jgi:serine/threonine protein kinase
MQNDIEILGDRYRLVEIIGQGTTSVMFSAEDLFLNRLVAVKMPRANLLSEDPEYARMFIKEARYQASFDHPNILPLFDCYESSRGPVLIMRYTRNSLRTLIGTQSLSTEFVVSAARQIADALDHCTQRGVAHRDVKPDNVLSDDSGYTYLTDFGLAAPLDDDEKVEESNWHSSLRLS